MSRIGEPTTEQETGWKEWAAARPAHVRAVAERFDPWTLYRIKDTGQRVTLVSFSEHDDGKVTLIVNLTGQFNLVTFDRHIFGIEPDDLEPCSLPTEAELTGTLLTDEAAIEAFVDEVRPVVLAARRIETEGGDAS